MRKILTIVILLISISAISQSKIKIDGVATVVGDNIVLSSEVEAFKQELLQQSEGRAQVDDCEMLEQIMHRKLLAHHAVIDSINVSDAEINSRVQQKIQYFSQQLGSEEKMLEFYGFDSMADLNGELQRVEKESLLINGMSQSITSSIDITPEEVKRYYNSLKAEDNLPEIGAEIELAQIVLKIDPSEEEKERIINRLNEIKSQVENGESFRMKAILYSDDPGVSQNSGLYTIDKESPFVKEFKVAAFSLDEGVMSEPFKSDFGYHILMVEKIKGKQRDVRHLLMQPEIDDEVLKQAKDSLINIRESILKMEISFEEAVLQYSSDKETRMNKGLMLNPQTSDSHFELTHMPPEIYGRINNLKAGEYSDVFYEETREGEKMYKFFLLKSKTEPHKADLSKDYVKIKEMALQKKQQETIDEWAKNKIGDTYVKINNEYKKCSFENNWLKM